MEPPKKNNDTSSCTTTPTEMNEKSLTRYSGWFHPHKSWKCIIFEYIISWFFRLDKLAFTCQQIMAATSEGEGEEEEDTTAATNRAATTSSSSSKEPNKKDHDSQRKTTPSTTTTSPTTTSPPKITAKEALHLMTLENAKVRNRMDSNRYPTLLDKALKQWSVAAKCPIVDYDLYIPHYPHLLQEWGILSHDDDEDLEEHMPKEQDILVKMRFPACLLDDSVAIINTTMDQTKDDKKKNTNHAVIRPTTGSSIDVAQILQQHSNVPIVLHFHGGGLVLGNANDMVGIDLMRSVCSEMMAAAAKNSSNDDDDDSSKNKKDDDSSKNKKQQQDAAAILLDIEYSLAPEHAFPIAIIQGLTVLQYLLHDLKCQNNNNKIHITGISAGGLLAAVTTLQGIRRFPNRIASSILLCPMLDPACQSDSFIRNETSSWLVPTAWLQWCWQVYLYQPPPPPSYGHPHGGANENNTSNESIKKQGVEEIALSPSLELAASTDTATTVDTATSTLMDDIDDNERNWRNQTTTGTTRSWWWWQQHKNNNSKLAPLMSPLWDDLQDLVDENKKNKTTSQDSSSLSSWPRFLITTNHGDPLHDDGMALIQKLRTAVAASLDGGEDNDKQEDNDSSTVVVVQHLDHDGTHWFGTVLDTQSNQELIHACKDILFPSDSFSD